jgi:hypothetical protein
MTKPNFGAGRASDALLRASGNGAVLYPGGGGSREFRRAAERREKRERKQQQQHTVRKGF